MRGTVWVIVLVGSFPACTEKHDKLASENVLELHLGGEYESLNAALRRPLRGAKKLASAAPAKKAAPKSDPREPQSEPPKKQLPQPDLPATDPPDRSTTRSVEFQIVTLAEGQTLYGLCRTHLGNGGRWKEVAALNGWSEARAGNLRVGQRVKLPVRK